MRTRNPGAFAALSFAILLLFLPACGRRGPQKVNRPEPKAISPQGAGGKGRFVMWDGVPQGVMEEAMKHHFAGLGHMERFEYKQAAAEFGEVRKIAPTWQPGALNLAIALLNQTGEQIEAAKSGNATKSAKVSNFDEALNILESLLLADPKNLHAHYCKGIILEQTGEWARAHDEFKAVTEGDPNDGHAWYWFGATMPAPDGSRQASIQEADLLIAAYEKALEHNPYLVPAIYRLSQAYGWAKKRDEQKKLLESYGRLDPERRSVPPGPGDTAAKVYGSMGRYAEVVGPTRPRRAPAGTLLPPRLDPLSRLEVQLPDGSRWAGDEDLDQSGAGLIRRARDRFGMGIAALDVDDDGHQDIYLTAAVVGPRGLRDALLRNLGDGKFEDITEAAGLPLDRAGLGVAAGDFDADLHVDLYLTGAGGNRLFRSLGGGKFEDITEAAGLEGEGHISPTARWLDLDQDGDLDLFVVNFAAAADAETAFTEASPSPVPCAAYRNDGKPSPAGGSEMTWAPLANKSAESNAVSGLSVAFTPWPDGDALTGEPSNSAAVAALDLDEDRDLDLVVAADGKPLRVVWNERLGRFRTDSLGSDSGKLGGMLVGDFNRDGHADLATLAPGGTGRILTNTLASSRVPGSATLETWPAEMRDLRMASLVDADLDGWVDLVGLPASGRLPVWTRNEGDRLISGEFPVTSQQIDPGRLSGLMMTDLAGDPLPDLLVFQSGEGPMIAQNVGNGRHWLGLRLGGRWGVSPKLMRTNPHGLGTKLTLDGLGLSIPHPQTTPEGGTGQSVAPFVMGLNEKEMVPLIRLRWPDGVMQCEMNEPADQVLDLSENNRKTGSCPVLFTWNGDRFVCLGDFLGGGGMGYLVAPGEYGQPDRDESLAITEDQLRPEGGVMRISITEPMDEVAYLDHLMLDVVDRPAGVRVAPDERFAPGGNRPTGQPIAWTQQIGPVAARDQLGADVTPRLAAWDRDTVDTFRRSPQWIGYAEDHGVELDFGDRLSGFGPNDRLVLCVAGWVEYPYSQTNYAAATAGHSLKPPVLERRRDDGTWEVLESDPGYPAGLPRMTTLELTGKLGGPTCVLRLTTNMECYYDQVFVAVRDAEAERSLRMTPLPVARAALGNRGYTREISPDGRLPLLYDYDYVDPAPLAAFDGKLTRYGDVSALLTSDDDRLCVVGPGDEARVEFDARSLPPLPEGWVRSYILRTYGYCKDADPFTAGSDTVEPLPWEGMPAYPFAPGVSRPSEPSYDAYLREFQTRPAGRSGM